MHHIVPAETSKFGSCCELCQSSISPRVKFLSPNLHEYGNFVLKKMSNLEILNAIALDSVDVPDLMTCLSNVVYNTTQYHDARAGPSAHPNPQNAFPLLSLPPKTVDHYSLSATPSIVYFEFLGTWTRKRFGDY